MVVVETSCRNSTAEAQSSLSESACLQEFKSKTDVSSLSIGYKVTAGNRMAVVVGGGVFFEPPGKKLG